eukprot:CAMPEP_0174839146 /NCGR_PEP_ID=MMETSP1114-20130205/7857_1 /TAXON_ID=312471 /ORGANISM="Neobodo designis, Strain CCAP 1951/1" /LENGTH=444 /DNA_ID=CAMNT_0016073267 /DNA_START=196 /DNA_END=1530 /DNA_ORIENTATION=+
MSTLRMVASEGWRFARHGNPSKVLQYEKFRIPFERRSNQVVVKMLSAPVHAHDKQYIEGQYGHVKPMQYPAVGGTEGVGIVEEVGSNVQLGVKEGDMVWVNNPRVGTWATHIVTHSNNIDVLPNRPDLELEWLGSMGTFHAAYQLINGFQKLEPGDVVLQNGASGAISQLCCAFARQRGLKMVQTMQLGRTEHTHLVVRYKQCGAYAVVPYSYARTNYMRRLLSDLPPPKLFLNHTGGPLASTTVKLLGDEGTVVTYGSKSKQPIQVANSDLIARDLKFRGFFLPTHMEQQSREARMRTHQTIIENMTLSQGFSGFRGQRFKMQGDSAFAFMNAWDADFSSRKSFLRMVGEYGEWRKPRHETIHYNTGKAIWEDLMQQLLECTGASDTPQSMKYYTPFGDFFSDFNDATQAKELGHREVFFKRPNMPRPNTSEDTTYQTTTMES